MGARKPQLAIVIPVWNLPEDLSDLLATICNIPIFSEVIVSDDGSDLCCDPEALGFNSDRLGARLLYLRSEERRHARNVALDAVTADNVIFFDSDDVICPEIEEIWQQHIASGVDEISTDFTIFRHSDSRILEAENREGSFPRDERRWHQVLDHAESALLDRRARTRLCGISAYPWNKIYRTDFLREHDIRCSETPVHNDIRLHWLSFVHARRVLALRTIGAIHVVGSRTHHLTTQVGRERFCVFDVFQDILTHIREEQGRQQFLRYFVDFAHNLCRWNLAQIDESLREDFSMEMSNLYFSLSPAEFSLYASWQPVEANRIVEFLTSGEMP